jgi:hypothetical protein
LLKLFESELVEIEHNTYLDLFAIAQKKLIFGDTQTVYNYLVVRDSKKVEYP